MDEKHEKLEEAYRKAVYVVFDDGREVVFHAGVIPEAVDAILRKQNATNFAFITAYNPYSKVLTESENQIRQEKLQAFLRSEGLRFLEGYGIDENGEWPPEQSVLILGITLEKSLEIGREFEQYAILYGAQSEEIKLIWCVEN